jgi:hypothetical protein
MSMNNKFADDPDPYEMAQHSDVRQTHRPIKMEARPSPCL